MSLQLRLRLHHFRLVDESVAFDWCLTIAFPALWLPFEAGRWKSNRNNNTQASRAGSKSTTRYLDNMLSCRLLPRNSP